MHLECDAPDPAAEIQHSVSRCWIEVGQKRLEVAARQVPMGRLASRRGEREEPPSGDGPDQELVGHFEVDPGQGRGHRSNQLLPTM